MKELLSIGYTLKGARQFVIDRFGEVGWKNVLDALPAEERKVFESPILASRWYPFSIQVHLYETTDKLFGKGDFTLCREIGHYTAQYELSTIHKIFLKLGKPRHLFKLAGVLWKKYYNQGAMAVSLLGGNKGFAEITDFNPLSKAFCIDLLGWIEKTLALAGGKNVKVYHTHCVMDGGPYCRYEGSWE